MTSHEIIVKGDDILLNVGKELDDKIYKKILKFISLNLKDGKVSIDNKDLAIIDDIIFKTIKGTDYNEQLNKYLGLFDALTNAVSSEQAERNDLKVGAIKDLWKSSNVNSKIIDKVVYDLGANGMKDVFVKAISNIVRDSSYFNLDLQSAEAKLRTVLIDDKYTERYVRQTAMDSLSQYQGALNDEVRVAYDFTVMNYITNTIETSRPICIHIHDTLGGKITDTQLKQVLNEYCPKGIPSEKRVTYETHSGEKKQAKAGSGMIEGTVFDNFSQLKGGYGCRHTAIWVRK